MEKIIKPARLVALGLFISALIIIYIVALYKLQIIEGAAYYEASRNNVVTIEDLPAARGNIMDRYGRVLVTNKPCYNLTINVQELLYEQDDPNAVILRLVEMVKEYGDKYTDTLPITMMPPFEYTDMTDIQKTMLNAYFNDKDLASNTSSVELMSYMRSRYKIDNNYTAEETRIIAGVRYELNVRYAKDFSTSDYIFVEDASMDLISALLESDIPGINIETSFVREYNTTYAAHVLGYTGMMYGSEVEKYSELGYKLNAQVGKDGAEYAFEQYLHGTDGEARVSSTASGTVTGTVYTEEPQPGNHVYLTLDIGLQEAAENALGSFITAENAKRQAANDELEKYGGAEEDYEQLITGGAVVAVDIKSGEPLAIASWPTYDLSTIMEDYSKLLENENNPLFNRALQGTYAPGSTFKPAVAIAGLAEGKIDTTTTITCEGIYEKYKDAGYTPKCWIYGKGLHGDLTVTEAITVSCNYFFYTVGDYLQISLMAKYAALFGLGEETGIELYEKTGVMASDEYMQEKEGRDMYAGDTLQAAIGQSDSLFNPLQIAEYCAAIANGGQRHTASILKSVRSYDFSETVFERGDKVLSSVDTKAEYYKAVQDGMYGVANDPVAGTVYSVFAGAPYKVAAKTGTAQTGSNITNNAVFMCYAPFDNPEVAIAVVIEKGSAGSAIAEVSRQVLDYYFSFKDSTVALESENSLLK